MSIGVGHVLGREVIIVSFYLYAIIELLAFFRVLDSDIIPISNASYLVSTGMSLSRTTL